MTTFELKISKVMGDEKEFHWIPFETAHEKDAPLNEILKSIVEHKAQISIAKPTNKVNCTQQVINFYHLAPKMHNLLQINVSNV